jgi:hypothetical protein
MKSVHQKKENYDPLKFIAMFSFIREPQATKIGIK